ncbi:hypothetical protein L210DRAFT_3542198 [Boletus edulis BED1]|uniref:Uncharacterized protein n=1 Tax=Boletus edulis BED1 TaxID=1328754 RepID=A0AAD4GF66_BOLED|nr:hypothetical protein L210DRAFT_3542198 [Boletus edulis BED1]
MYLSGALNRRSMITAPSPLDTSRFTLDTTGVSGFFGGDEAISAMGTVHIYRGRRWLGWYNTPGSYQIARQYGLVAKSAFFKGCFPGVRKDPASLFEFDGWQGPRFLAVASGTVIDNTGHLASVLLKKCASIDGVHIPGRAGSGVGVTIVRLNTIPPKVVYPERITNYSPFFATIPISVSLAACIASGVYNDWFSCSLILWGILSNGISCLVIGFGSLCFTHHEPAPGSPPGDGILGSGKEFVLLQGDEGAVNSITIGKFSLEFPSKYHDEYIGYCSILLTIQFIAQLFLIPQGSLFGQIMFISSLGVSWVYNSWLSAFDKEKIQQHILLDVVLKNPSLTKYTLTTRTAAVVFALCVLSPENPSKILEAYLPNDTKVWRRWKETVLQRFRSKEKLHFKQEDWNLSGYTDEERKLLRSLYGDAQAAYDGFVSVDNKEMPAEKS